MLCTRLMYYPVELQTICDWISPMDFSAAQERILATRQEGTCDWFIQSPTVTDFIAHKGSVIWAVGIPGSGKTVLSSAIIDYLTRFTRLSPDRAAVAYAYCDYRMQESQTTLGLVACFLRQLLEVYWEVNVSVPEDVHAIYYLHKETKTGPSMAECLEMLAALIAGCGNVFVVIDGLDECGPATRQELVKTIRSAAPSIHLLITSRYLGDIKATLDDVSIVEVSAPGEDLKCYAQGCIEKYPELQTALGTLPTEMSEAYLEHITQSAAGMFPVVQFLVQAWADDSQRLEAGPPSLSLVFRELDAFYSEITMKIFDQPSPDAALARQILIWVAFSRRPVTVSEVTDVIGAEAISQVIASFPGVLAGPELLTTVCAGILTIDSKAGTLRPAHVTLETYLQRNQEGIFAQAQEYITSSCMRYLSFEEFKAGPCANDQDMLARLQKHPFFHYAANEWGHHALGAAETACKEAIIAFLDNRQVVESVMQAKSITRDWQLYPQHVDSESYPHGVTGTALAAFFGLATIVEALMDNSVNKRSCSDPQGALYWAATGGSAEVIKLLLRRGVTPNVRGVMRAAAENGYEDVIRILVANGGDVNAGCYEDEGNALQTAAIKGNESLILCLLELGADPNRVAGELGSVLHIAAVNGDESITRLLLENGADPNTKGGMYGFALQAAVEEGHENIIKMLLDNGADVNLEGGPYGNAFQAAVENGDQDIVELLLAHGANINTMIGGEKYTALQEVARRGLEAMVEFLIDRGANMDSRQRNGQTALHQAAKEGQAGVVALLVQKGANPNIRDQRGFAALDWAKKKNFTEVARVLEAARQIRI
ncbi:ankyrin repeat-containing domain protein [Aspergillus alliaceus]|uniref:Ankyrin repeat-containing domain protein n=1 Tax=Petromyces alliaceus TaxID=209559 RepID=A0A5N7CMX6_PETAA|nr:ankyrin repeat-containing domain protein [Aspergillus alliaceus]